MILKKIFLLSFYCVISLSLFSQHGLKLAKKVRIDTLRIWINYPEDFGRKEILNYDSIFSSALNQFNENSSFIVEKDSSISRDRIILNMEPIKYVDAKRNILSTGLTLALIGGHVYMIGTYGWTLLIWPIMLPATISKVKISIDPKMVVSKSEIKDWITSNGYLRRRDKQSQKFENRFRKYIFKFLKKIDKQNIKNSKSISDR